MVRRFVRDNGLTLVLLTAFSACLLGQLVSGWLAQNQDLAWDGRAGTTLSAYAASSGFLSSVFENWESEFLQMAAYVVLTAMLFQRGSAESRDPDDPGRAGDDPDEPARDPRAPWPTHAGRIFGRIYANSLGLALGLLFLASFVLHWVASAAARVEEAALHGMPGGSLPSHLGDAQLWFESFQNWQSEFLSTAVLAVLTIFLRQRGSPESKPVAAPTAQTGA